jgi:hypothetical protein
MSAEPLEVAYAPWAQRGLIAAADGTVDDDGVPEQSTTTVTARLTVDGVQTPAEVAFRLRGPADAGALAAGQIVRTDPVDGETEAEPNLFPFVEFVSPHLPWVLTPATTAGNRLIPWLVLVVIVEADADLRAATSGRSAVLTAPIAQLPELTEAHAWAHVQSDDAARPVPDVIDETPALARARLVCPRHLAPATTYLAAVVPAFEGGRLAGLGLEVDDAAITEPAWDHAEADTHVDLPVYHSWTFTTAPEPTSFEALAKRLRPVPAPPTVGSHDLDVGEPGGGLPAGTKPAVVQYRGALVAPGSTDGPGVSAQLQQALRRSIDAPTPATPTGEYDHLTDDPVVTAPLYGGRAAGRTVLPPAPKRPGQPDAQPFWLSELNLAPPHRGVAGLGVEAVRTTQEALMAEAWPQAAGLGTINEYLVRANAASAFGRAAHTRVLAESAGLADETVLRLTGTAHARIRSSGTSTVAGALAAHTDFARAAFTATLARVCRLGGRPARLGVVGATPLARQVDAALLDDEQVYAPLAALVVPRGSVLADAGLVDRLLVAAGGEPVEAPPGPGTAGDGLVAVRDQFATGIDRFTVSSAGVGGASRPEVTAWSSLQASAGQIAGVAGSVAATATAALHSSPLRADTDAAVRSLIADATALAERAGAIARWERPTRALPAQSKTELGLLGAAAVTMQQHLDDLLDAEPWHFPGSTPVMRPAGQLQQLAAALRAGIDPVATVLAAVQHRIHPVPQPGVDGLPPPGLRAHPVFATPGFDHLVALGVDYVCPGIGDLGSNSVSLLETNQAAVESFLVGFNDELARELLWREYPAVLTDTWLTRFWSPPGIGIDDITPIAGWDGARHLGDGARDADAVVFIRGDLLVRYPSALVYLLPGVVTRRGKATVISPDYDRPVAPAFIARIGRGARVYGFPLDARELAADPANGAGGYFVVIEEHAAETRFGLDDPDDDQFTETPTSWDDLGWGHLVRNDNALDALTHATLTGVRIAGLELGDDTWGDDAAAMARITLRRPFRLVAHANTLLPPQ